MAESDYSEDEFPSPERRAKLRRDTLRNWRANFRPDLNGMVLDQRPSRWPFSTKSPGPREMRVKTRADRTCPNDAACAKDGDTLIPPSSATATLTVSRALLYRSRKARFIWSVKGFVK